MDRLKVTRLLLVIIFLLGLSFSARPTYYYMKGIYAQFLLEKAWIITKRTGDSSKAWSWADTLPVARLKIPAIDLNQIVLQGEEIEAMAFGPAIVDSSLESKNISIAGHRDSFFRKLEQLKEGDMIHLERLDSNMSYRVSDIIVTEPSDIRWLEAGANDRLTLVTCYPFNFIGEAPMRYIVIARPELII